MQTDYPDQYLPKLLVLSSLAIPIYIFALIVLPWGILLQSKNRDAELSDELKTHINNHVKIDIE